MATPLCPFVGEQSGYSAQATAPVISIGLDGGPDRIRKDAVGDPTVITCTWFLNRGDYDEWMRWFEKQAFYGSIPVLVDLVSSFFLPVRHRCTIVPGSVKTGNVRGQSYRVSARLRAEPLRHEREGAVFHLGGQITVASPIVDLNVQFTAGGFVQVLGAQIDDEINPPVNLDGIYPITSVPDANTMNLTSANVINPDWDVLDDYPSDQTIAHLTELIVSYDFN